MEDRRLHCLRFIGEICGTDLSAAYNARAVAWESVLLLGGSAAIDAGREWHGTLWRLESLVRNPASSPEEWADGWRQLARARDLFYKAARKELGTEFEN
jgi:nitroimidazol reductase NimA-like FMN-containing flavoprotein (pyridoxamine 5'-phosphate oxidase superfamily)